MLGHLSEDVYPGSKYVRGNIILVLSYLSFVLNINIDIAKLGLDRRGGEHKKKKNNGAIKGECEQRKQNKKRIDCRRNLDLGGDELGGGRGGEGRKTV